MAENAAYYQANKDKWKTNRIQATAWRLANQDRIKEYRIARRTEANAYNAVYSAAHPGSWAKWRERNPEKARELGRNKTARYRARRAAVTVVLVTSEQLNQKLRYWGGKCWMCGGAFEHWDHVKPISKGGAHILANLRPACASCNFHKHAKWPLGALTLNQTEENNA